MRLRPDSGQAQEEIWRVREMRQDLEEEYQRRAVW